MGVQKKTIAVLFGGCSTEYEVSLKSAYSIINSINKEKYELILIGIEKKTGRWLLFQGDAGLIKENLWYEDKMCKEVYPSMNKNVHGIFYIDEGKANVITLDAALPVLHGKNGEDGTVQGVLELMSVPVIGCGVLSSALCMDKELAHRVAAAAGIKTAESVTMQECDKEEDIQKAAEMIGYPLFVKPVRAGSSFGITKVSEARELPGAVAEAFRHDTVIILEKEVEGFEVGCAVLGTKELCIGEVDEIELSDGFFDYTEKYTLKTSSIHVPARISAEKAREIKQTALEIYRLLGCTGFARVDMFLTPSGEIYFNEVNTIPGFTSHSRYPNMLKAAGISFEEVVERLLQMEG